MYLQRNSIQRTFRVWLHIFLYKLYIVQKFENHDYDARNKIATLCQQKI